jgi:hypothetical protein
VPAQLKHWPPLLVPLHRVHWPEPPHTSHFTLCSVTLHYMIHFRPHQRRYSEITQNTNY